MSGRARKSKVELPPLLEVGLHTLSKAELQTIAVNDFPLSQRREPLWHNLMELVDLLKDHGVKCDVWVDGSYLTKKIDPDDIDLVVDVYADTMLSATPVQEVLLWKIKNQEFYCDKKLDTYLTVNAPVGHVLYPESFYSHEVWKRDFGFAYVSREVKGIAVLEVRP